MFVVVVVVVVVVWFCCSSWLAFLTLAYHSHLMLQFLLHWVICFGRYLIVHTQFFWKILGLLWVFWYSQKLIFGFSICSLFGRQLCQNFGWVESEPYVPSHIAEPPCLLYAYKARSNFFRFLWQTSQDLKCELKNWGLTCSFIIVL